MTHREILELRLKIETDPILTDEEGILMDIGQIINTLDKHSPDEMSELREALLVAGLESLLEGKK